MTSKTKKGGALRKPKKMHAIPKLPKGKKRKKGKDYAFSG